MQLSGDAFIRCRASFPQLVSTVVELLEEHRIHSSIPHNHHVRLHLLYISLHTIGSDSNYVGCMKGLAIAVFGVTQIRKKCVAQANHYSLSIDGAQKAEAAEAEAAPALVPAVAAEKVPVAAAAAETAAAAAEPSASVAAEESAPVAAGKCNKQQQLSHQHQHQHIGW